MMMNYKYHPFIDGYMAKIENGKASKRMKKAMPYIRSKIDGAFIDSDKIYRAVELIEKYFEMKLLDWELFVIALVHCYKNDTVVFSSFYIMMGRGNGKNGFISGLAWYLTTEDHGIKGYNVDIIANSEDQAKTSFNDIYEMLTNNWGKLKNFFYKSLAIIESLKTNSYIKYNTSNARTKDGKRSACLIFDERHEYENSKMIGVFTSGFGKRKHSRTFSITTNGYVREGVLDNDLALVDQVLNGEANLKMCPLIYEMDTDEEVKNPDLWDKANPSLEYFAELKTQMDEEFIAMQYDKQIELDFYTKRMNRPRSGQELPVADYKFIQATNKPIPDLTGWECTVGIDYAQINDFASVNLHFKKGDERYDINHSWLCLQSPELWRLKCPYEQWANEGLITLVDDVAISAKLIADYIFGMMATYNIVKIIADHNRFSLLSEELKKIGFSVKDKNVMVVRPNDIYKVQVVINNCFLRNYFNWGNNPVLRWAVNNTKLERTDTGNFYYGKIEQKSRKTDPFMAVVHSMIGEDDLPEVYTGEIPDLGVYTY